MNIQAGRSALFSGLVVVSLFFTQPPSLFSSVQTISVQSQIAVPLNLQSALNLIVSTLNSTANNTDQRFIEAKNFIKHYIADEQRHPFAAEFAQASNDPAEEAPNYLFFLLSCLAAGHEARTQSAVLSCLDQLNLPMLSRHLQDAGAACNYLGCLGLLAATSNENALALVTRLTQRIFHAARHTLHRHFCQDTTASCSGIGLLANLAGWAIHHAKSIALEFFSACSPDVWTAIHNLLRNNPILTSNYLHLLANLAASDDEEPKLAIWQHIDSFDEQTWVTIRSQLDASNVAYHYLGLCNNLAVGASAQTSRLKVWQLLKALDEEAHSALQQCVQSNEHTAKLLERCLTNILDEIDFAEELRDEIRDWHTNLTQ